MSIFSSLYVGASGMRVNESAIAVIGDNIANMNTVGFKGSRPVFADMLHQTILGSAGPSQVGQGSAVAGVERLHQQGALLGTGVTTDVAVGGEGMFLLKGEQGGEERTFYTRNGQFHIDHDGYLVNVNNLNLQGYQANAAGNLSNELSNLKIDPTVSEPVATTSVALEMNLSFDLAVADSKGFGDLGDPAAAPEPGEDAATGPLGDYATSVVVYDAAGSAHTVDIIFAKTDANTWAWQAVVPSDQLSDPGDEHYTVVASGELGFVDGKLDTQIFGGEATDEDAGTFEIDFAGVSGQEVGFDFGQAIQSGGDGSGTGSVAGANATTVVDTDGRPPGDFQFLQILSDGRVLGTYSNGDERTIGQIALAEFTNATGLEAVGDNLFRETQASGEPTVGEPSTGARGQLFAGALEGSSVELTQEFTQMIIAQRGFQASSRTVITADQMLTEVVNLKR